MKYFEIFEVEEDEPEAIPETKKRRYSPSFLRLTIPGGASSHDEPSSSHCNESGDQVTVVHSHWSGSFKTGHKDTVKGRKCP